MCQLKNVSDKRKRKFYKMNRTNEEILSFKFLIKKFSKTRTAAVAAADVAVLLLFCFLTIIYLGSGCDSVGIAVASDTRGALFGSTNLKSLY